MTTANKSEAAVVATEAIVHPVVTTESRVSAAQAALDAQHPEYMSFGDAAKQLGVRFQQVYNRAVDRKKMQWLEVGKRKLVLRTDVEAWAKVREAYFADSK